MCRIYRPRTQRNRHKADCRRGVRESADAAVVVLLHVAGLGGSLGGSRLGVRRRHQGRRRGGRRRRLQPGLSGSCHVQWHAEFVTQPASHPGTIDGGGDDRMISGVRELSPATLRCHRHHRTVHICGVVHRRRNQSDIRGCPEPWKTVVITSLGTCELVHIIFCRPRLACFAD